MTSVGSSNVSPLDNPQVVDDDGLQVTCFTEDLNDVSFHFQIIGIKKQNNTVSVSSILGGTSDNTGSSIARRLVLKTGLSVILACNIPKNSPMLEANAERKLIEKLTALGYTISKSQGLTLTWLRVSFANLRS